MVDLLKETEETPTVYPDVPFDCAHSALSVQADLVWSRIESYTRTRYTPRLLTWVIEGAQDECWIPPLGPIVTFTAERWDESGWVSETLPDGPLGQCLPTCGVFKITAQVGAGDPPVAVNEAFARLAKYISAIQRTPGERLAMRQMSLNRYEQPPSRQTPSQDSVRIQEVDGSAEYLANWPARALQLSGAADLLRPYRRQK